ncbi:2-aminomuconic semialdehyde dehydrogenase [Halotydeus destructor]|nr:2-aminomuconic semialdehyde dehydrogenase [Halotydeus destructor]
MTSSQTSGMSPNVLRIENFINGEFRDTVDHFHSINPATGEPCAVVPDSGPEDIELAVIAAKNAFSKWSNTKMADRCRILFKVADLIEANLKELALYESIDQGKPLSLAEQAEIPRAAYNFRHFATTVQSSHDKAFVTTHENGLLNYTIHEPVGVVGVITPWNLPLVVLTFKLAPALAYGNTVVAKPSEMTSMTAYKLCHIFKEAGLPAGVVNIVFGRGRNTGPALIDHKLVDAISFTGGTVTGTGIAERAAKNVKKLSLELGGKNPAIVFNDVDLNCVIPQLLRSCFLNQGEICLCTSRLYVQSDIYDEFLERFVSEARKLKVGDPLDSDTFMGPLISKEHLDKVFSYVNIAKAEGATIHCGGTFERNLPSHNANGYFFRPTIVSGVTDESRCLEEEIFGPFVCVMPFKSEEEVIRRANDTVYGLSATGVDTQCQHFAPSGQQGQGGHGVVQHLDEAQPTHALWRKQNVRLGARRDL